MGHFSFGIVVAFLLVADANAMSKKKLNCNCKITSGGGGIGTPFGLLCVISLKR